MPLGQDFNHYHLFLITGKPLLKLQIVDEGLIGSKQVTWEGQVCTDLVSKTGIPSSHPLSLANLGHLRDHLSVVHRVFVADQLRASIQDYEAWVASNAREAPSTKPPSSPPNPKNLLRIQSFEVLDFWLGNLRILPLFQLALGQTIHNFSQNIGDSIHYRLQPRQPNLLYFSFSNLFF